MSISIMLKESFVLKDELSSAVDTSKETSNTIPDKPRRK